MKLTICLGSSCHLKGSRQVVERIQQLVESNGLKDTLGLAGTFCMGKCQTGVSVTLDGEYYSVSPQTVDAFFEREVLSRVNKN